MHDYKYDSLLKKTPTEEMVAPMNLKSTFLIPVAEAFVANLERTETFAVMPSQIAFQVRRDQLWVDCAEIELVGKLNPDFYKFLGTSPDEKLRDVVLRIKRDFDATHPNKAERFQVGTHVGINYIQELLKTTEAMRHSMEAVLSSVILQAWVAFEYLASDLWTVAVDKGPTELRLRVSVSNKLLKPDDNIGPKQLLDAEFDPSTNYGSSLRELGRVSFQRLDYIKRFYAVAFDYDFNKLFSEVESGYIIALSAFRNALIHNAGKADKHFVKQVAAFPELREIAKGDVLLLNGELVKKLRGAARNLGTKLIQFVDDVLTPPATQP